MSSGVESSSGAGGSAGGEEAPPKASDAGVVTMDSSVGPTGVGFGDDAGIDTTDAESSVATDANPPEESFESSSAAGATDGGTCSGVFCEDFEQGQIDPTRWDTQTNGGETIVVQQQNVAHGKYSAQFHGLGKPTGSSGYAYLIAKNTPDSLQTHSFGRAYFYMAPKVTSIDLGLVFGGTAGFPKPTYMSLAAHSGGWQFGFIKLDGSPTGESQAYPAATMPVATWFCLEWEFNDDPDTINVWGDAAAIGSLNSNDVAYPPNHPAGSIFNGMSSGLIGAFTAFGIGFYDWHPSGFAFDVYYDDFVLDTKRIGCL